MFIFLLLKIYFIQNFCFLFCDIQNKKWKSSKKRNFNLISISVLKSVICHSIVLHQNEKFISPYQTPSPGISCRKNKNNLILGSTGGAGLSGNADFQSAAPRIHSLNEKLHETYQELKTMWQNKKVKLEQCYHLCVFQLDANKVFISIKLFGFDSFFYRCLIGSSRIIFILCLRVLRLDLINEKRLIFKRIIATSQQTPWFVSRVVTWLVTSSPSASIERLHECASRDVARSSDAGIRTLCCRWHKSDLK